MMISLSRICSYLSLPLVLFGQPANALNRSTYLEKKMEQAFTERMEQFVDKKFFKVEAKVHGRTIRRTQKSKQLKLGKLGEVAKVQEGKTSSRFVVQKVGFQLYINEKVKMSSLSFIKEIANEVTNDFGGDDPSLKVHTMPTLSASFFEIIEKHKMYLLGIVISLFLAGILVLFFYTVRSYSSIAQSLVEKKYENSEKTTRYFNDQDIFKSMKKLNSVNKSNHPRVYNFLIEASSTVKNKGPFREQEVHSILARKGKYRQLYELGLFQFPAQKIFDLPKHLKQRLLSCLSFDERVLVFAFLDEAPQKKLLSAYGPEDELERKMMTAEAKNIRWNKHLVGDKGAKAFQKMLEGFREEIRSNARLGLQMSDYVEEWVNELKMAHWRSHYDKAS